MPRGHTSSNSDRTGRAKVVRLGRAGTAEPGPSAGARQARRRAERRRTMSSVAGVPDASGELVERERGRPGPRRDQVGAGTKIQVTGDGAQATSEPVSCDGRPGGPGNGIRHERPVHRVIEQDGGHDRSRSTARARGVQGREASAAAYATDARGRSGRHRTDGCRVRPTDGGGPCGAGPGGSPARHGWTSDAGSHDASLACGCWADTCASLCPLLRGRGRGLAGVAKSGAFQARRPGASRVAPGQGRGKPHDQAIRVSKPKSATIPCAASKLAGREPLEACGQSATVPGPRTEWGLAPQAASADCLVRLPSPFVARQGRSGREAAS